MAARTPKAPNKTPNRVTGAKKPPVSRAQLKAMEARAASAARASAFARGEDLEEQPASSRSTTSTRTGRTPRGGTRTGVRAGAERTVGAYPMPEFSVRTEMEYQRRDLIRLLIVAAIIIVVFIILTFFLR